MARPDRELIPQDPEYFHALGLASVAFARLEWDAVWCCERLETDYIRTIEARKKTAGKIASDMVRLFGQVSDGKLRTKIEPLAEDFKEIVFLRNGLFHGKPGTSAGGEQRLFRNGQEWTIEMVGAFSDRCVRASRPLNALLFSDFAEGSFVQLGREPK